MRVAQAVGGFSTTRQCFNKLEERRVLKRLEAIPKLREAGVIMESDIWNQIFVIFDHGVKHEFGIDVAVRDLDHMTVSLLVKALTATDLEAESVLTAAGKAALLGKWKQALTQLKGICPGGATSFVEGTKRAKTCYLNSVRQKYAGMSCTTYVNFDTDGGNNCGPCYAAIDDLVQEADVVQGHVTGVGSWVDQDCATKVAKQLKGTATLRLNFPDDAQADELFRQDVSRWIKVWRACPVCITVSAGSVRWAARHGPRNENAVDCLLADGETVQFDPPDVSDPTFTKAVVKGLQAGESTILYLLSRLPADQLLANLSVEVDGVQGKVACGNESLQGIALGYHWLSVLGVEDHVGVVANKSVLCSRLRHRMEDDLSFAWNLPTRSGSTAAMGRAKTDRRPPVSNEQQPEEPEAPSLKSAAELMQAERNVYFGAPLGFSGGGAPNIGVLFGGAPQAFGCAPPGASAKRGGGFFGASAVEQSSCAAPSGLFGSAAPESRSRGMASPPKGKGKAKGRGGCNPFGGAFGSASAEPALESSDGAVGPSRLLAASAYMRYGAAEPPKDALQRSVRALQHLASASVSPTPVAQVQRPPNAREDPLVASLFGGPPAATAASSIVHSGFTCDATSVNPIPGTRFKSTSALDVDITEAARRAGQLAFCRGFKPITDPATAMRCALHAAIIWWRMLWAGREDIFGTLHPDLRTLSLHDLANAISKLPEF